MRSRNSIVVVVALAVVGVAWSVPWTAEANCPSSSVGSGQPVSWHVAWDQQEAPEEVVLVPEVPGAAGIVITDIWVAINGGSRYALIQRSDDEDEQRVLYNNTSLLQYRSGVTFCKGSSIVLRNISNQTSESITIMGYTY